MSRDYDYAVPAVLRRSSPHGAAKPVPAHRPVRPAATPVPHPLAGRPKQPVPQIAAFAGRPGDLAVPGLGAEALIAVPGGAHQVEPPITPAAPQRHLYLAGKATALGGYCMPRCPAGGS